MEQVQLKTTAATESAPAQLEALIEAGNFDGALALNAQIAGEMPFMPIDGWCIKRIEDKWGSRGKAIATDAWAKARTNGEDWQRDIRRMWDADCAALQGRERLAALSARLMGAKPRLGEAKARVEALDAQLEAAKLKTAPDEPALKPEPKSKSKYSADVFRPAPLPPENATALEQLTYPRGLVGHVVQYMLDTNALPDRWMALAGALSVCAKALDRKVLGPRDNSVVLFILILAESGAGKNHILNCIKTILKAWRAPSSALALHRCNRSSKCLREWAAKTATHPCWSRSTSTEASSIVSHPKVKAATLLKSLPLSVRYGAIHHKRHGRAASR
jgi:hypothetical protein